MVLAAILAEYHRQKNFAPYTILLSKKQTNFHISVRIKPPCRARLEGHQPTWKLQTSVETVCAKQAIGE